MIRRRDLAAAAFRQLLASARAHRAGSRLTPLGPPLSLAVGVTGRCTYRCVHCGIWRDSYEEYDLRAWSGVFDQLAEWMGPAHLAIAGGEPFLRSDLGELVAAAADRGLLPSLVTNGAPPVDPARIAAWPLVSLTLSIDSLSPGPHDALHRAQGAHARVVALTMRLCEMGLAPRLRVAAVLTRLNFDEIVPLAEWTASQGIGGFSVQPLGEPFGTGHDPAWYRTLGLGVAPDQVARIVGELMRGIRKGWPVLNPARQLSFMPGYYEEPERQIIPCTVGITSLGIGPSGELRFCPYLPAFGHVKDSPIREQWVGPGAERARAMVQACTRGCSIMNCTFSPTLIERLRRWRRHLRSVVTS
ncbi:MAG: radical SAM protein [Candidatus Eisenbacteria bacterium]|nr:radical SAM protein [Candidatus Eisenbacteria bacterium]